MTSVPPRLAAYLDYISHESLARGYPPAFRELAQAVGLKSLNAVWENVMRLREAGLLVEVQKQQKRSLRLPAPPTDLPCKRCGFRIKHYAVDHSARLNCAVALRT